jgi:hypothetical protein
MIGSFSRPRFHGGSAVATLALMLLGFGGYPPRASADLLTPGMSGPPDLFILAGMTQEASTSGSLVSATFTASYIENVYSDPGNVFGAGDLDFVIQVKDTGAVAPFSGDIEHITNATYTGFMTDVGYDIDTLSGFTPGTATAPFTVDRSNGGDTISWDFVNPGGLDTLTPGDTTALLVVETNATNYNPGLLSAIDGGSATVDGFAAAPVPEPGALTLLAATSWLLGARRPRRATSSLGKRERP